LRDCDPDHLFMGRMGEHPELGRIDLAHVRLDVLARHFPDEYAALAAPGMDVFGVVRDPLDRFGSALRQLLWQYEERPMTLIPAAELRETTLRMLGDIAAEIDAPSHKFIFFARQRDYVFAGDTQVTRNLVPMDMVAALIGYFSRRTDTPMDEGRRSNQNVELRVKGGLGQVAYKANAALRRALPAGLHGRVKRAGLALLATKKTAAEASGLLDLPEIRAFVAEHYAADARLHAAVEAERGAIGDALAATRLHPVDLMA
jgi:hypothetical protein